MMSRASTDDEVTLNDRPKMAWDKRADVFLSIHNNNLAANANPFKGSPHGYSIFYYEPQSLPLAQAIYKNYGRLVKIPSEELRFGDLLVLRVTGMPAVITESAYLTYPEQEALLLDAKFRDTLAEAMVDGLRDFFDAERARQNGAPKARKRKGGGR
jgi:N-acetylmuramoyl-L-alanine amidase